MNYYNGKMVCIINHLDDNDFTVGKVYDVVDGKFIDNDGDARPMMVGEHRRLTCINDLNNSWFSTWHYKFIPFVNK